MLDGIIFENNRCLLNLHKSEEPGYKGPESGKNLLKVCIDRSNQLFPPEKWHKISTLLSHLYESISVVRQGPAPSSF